MIKSFNGHTTFIGEDYVEAYADMISVINSFNRLASEEEEVQKLIAEDNKLIKELVQFTKTVLDISNGHIGQTSD